MEEIDWMGQNSLSALDININKRRSTSMLLPDKQESNMREKELAAI